MLIRFSFRKISTFFHPSALSPVRVVCWARCLTVYIYSFRRGSTCLRCAFWNWIYVIKSFTGDGVASFSSKANSNTNRLDFFVATFIYTRNRRPLCYISFRHFPDGWMGERIIEFASNIRCTLQWILPWTKEMQRESGLEARVSSRVVCLSR